MSPKRESAPKQDRRERCSCTVTFGFIGALDGVGRSAACRCNCRVVNPGEACGMCRSGLHGAGIVWKVQIV